MTRGRYYSTVMPLWAIVYVIGLILFDNTVFTVVGALVFAVLAVLGSAVIKPGPAPAGGRQRNRKRYAK